LFVYSSDDATRVVLDTDADNPSDYINASLITVSDTTTYLLSLVDVIPYVIPPR